MNDVGTESSFKQDYIDPHPFDDASPQISQAICYDSGSYGTSRTCLVRRLPRVPTHRHPPDFGKSLIRRNLRCLATKCVKYAG